MGSRWTLPTTAASGRKVIVTDKYVFLHLHKSGGTFVNLLLRNCVPGARPVGYHLPYRMVPADFRDFPVMGTVRSPWAYYVSWYHFQLGLAERNILFQVCSDKGSLDFKPTISNLLNLWRDEPRLRALEAGLPEDFQSGGLNLTRSCVGEIRSRGAGFYSFLFERLYEGARSPRILRVEHLRDELRGALIAFGELPNPCIERFLEEVPDLNVSKHGPVADYFDAELAGEVALADRKLIERFGYSL